MLKKIILFLFIFINFIPSVWAKYLINDDFNSFDSNIWTVNHGWGSHTSWGYMYTVRSQTDTNHDLDSKNFNEPNKEVEYIVKFNYNYYVGQSWNSYYISGGPLLYSNWPNSWGWWWLLNFRSVYYHRNGTWEGFYINSQFSIDSSYKNSYWKRIFSWDPRWHWFSGEFKIKRDSYWNGKIEYSVKKDWWIPVTWSFNISNSYPFKNITLDAWGWWNTFILKSDYFRLEKKEVRPICPNGSTWIVDKNLKTVGDASCGTSDIIIKNNHTLIIKGNSTFKFNGNMHKLTIEPLGKLIIEPGAKFLTNENISTSIWNVVIIP